ncbi:hypothetical protein P7C70_g137, partial [Phenoliferia sp. Uapishka_3]
MNATQTCQKPCCSESPQRDGYKVERCSKCHNVYYSVDSCSKECQVADWKRHKAPCEAIQKAASNPNPAANKDIDAVEILSESDSQNGQLFRPIKIYPNDSIFRGQGDVSPISNIFGLPLLLKRPGADWRHGKPGTSCQLATYMMKSAESGLAPLSPWDGPGTTLLARQDKGPLTVQQAEAITAFFASLIAEFGVDGTCSQELMIPNKLYLFMDWYCSWQHRLGREGWEDARYPLDLPYPQAPRPLPHAQPNLVARRTHLVS